MSYKISRRYLLASLVCLNFRKAWNWQKLVHYRNLSFNNRQILLFTIFHHVFFRLSNNKVYFSKSLDYEDNLIFFARKNSEEFDHPWENYSPSKLLEFQIFRNKPLLIHCVNIFFPVPEKGCATLSRQAETKVAHEKKSYNHFYHFTNECRESHPRLLQRNITFVLRSSAANSSSAKN